MTTVERKRPDDLRSERLEKQFADRHFPALYIDGFRVTFHARIRMVARLIEIDWVSDALTKPSRPNHDGTRKYVGDMATVVVCPRRREVITVAYGVLNDADAPGAAGDPSADVRTVRAAAPEPSHRRARSR